MWEGCCRQAGLVNNRSDFSLGTRCLLWVLSLTNQLQDHEIVSFVLWGSLSYSAPISPVAWALAWSLLAEAESWRFHSSLLQPGCCLVALPAVLGVLGLP